MDVTEGKAKAHVLLYPFFGSGHIIPLLDLAHRLLTRGISVTVLVTPPNLSFLDSILAVHPSSLVQPLVLPFQPSTASKDGFIAVLRGMRESHYPAIIQWFRAHHNPPVAIVSDLLIGWSHHLACELGIKRLVFSPTSGFSHAVTNSLWRELPEIGDPDDVEGVMELPSVPGRPIYPLWQVSRPYLSYKRGDPEFDFFREGMLGNSASWGVVYNSFTELEGQYLDHIKGALGHDRVWAVGPLLPDSAGPAAERGGGPTVPTGDLMAWLDARADSSVVYVCFGSRAVLTRAQMEPLAEALERSGVHFVWCVIPADGRHVGCDVGAIPEGFEDRVTERGIVVKGWAPQVAILRHRAVGAFLTHCGWNSTLEGISAGTMMLTWPQGVDQFSNTKLLVDQLGVGIRVGEATRKIPDPAELSRVLKECVDENGRKEEKARAKEMRDKAIKVVLEGGSSQKQLDVLVGKLFELKIESKNV